MAGLAGCGKLDISEMSPDNVVAIGNKVWVKAEVEEKIWIYAGRPCTVIKLEEACIAGICDDAAEIPKAVFNAVQNANLLDCGGGAAGGGDEGGGEDDPCAGDCSEDPDCPNYQPGGCGETDAGTDVPSDETTSDPRLATGSDREAQSIRPGVSSEKDKVKQASNAVDLRSINNRGYQGMAVIPSAAVIPMRNNRRTYGPYASSNFGSSCGGTQVEVNTDLAPWVFGSIAGMNGAGQTLVESSAIGLVKAETGGLTIPGLPVSAFSNLGVVLGSGGATLSGMNFSYGSGGITTSYEFKTYTPKFGGLSRHLVDRIKDISRNRTEQLRFFRNQQSNLNKVSRQIKRFNRAFPKNGDRNDAANNRPSLQRILIGEIYNWQKEGQRTVIGVDTINDSVSEMVYDFEKKAYISWDNFFGPISKKGDGGLPRYASFNPTGHKSSPILPHPPFSISGQCYTSIEHDEYNLEITQDYLDPLTNKVTKDDHHIKESGTGHVVDIVGRKDEVPQQGLITNFYHLDDENRYSEDYRFLGMRGPLLLHSWGYDLDGKPVPNEADIENNTKNGQFKTENLKDAFLQDWLGKPATWPVAPIDLRFDRDRGLWVSPQSYKIVVGKIIEEVPCFGEGKGVIIPYGKKLFDKEGSEIDNSQATNPNNECDIGINDIEYEWILVNINCDEKWYCCTTDVPDCYECFSSTDPAGCGPAGAVSGPYNSLAECQAACLCNVTPTPTPQVSQSPTPDDCSGGIEVITSISLGSGGLIAQRKRIVVQCAVDIDSITIPVTDCEPPPPSEPEPSVSVGETPTPTPTPTSTGTPTPTPTPTPTSTGTPTPTPTPTSTGTPTPTPTPSSSSGTTPTPTVTQADTMISIVDRIGRKHRIGELVYAYFDTSTEKYIVLEKHPEPKTPTIYGKYSGGQITVEYAAGMDFCDKIYKGAVYDVVDKLGLTNESSYDCPAIAIRMEKLPEEPEE